MFNRCPKTKRAATGLAKPQIPKMLIQCTQPTYPLSEHMKMLQFKLILDRPPWRPGQEQTFKKCNQATVISRANKHPAPRALFWL